MRLLINLEARRDTKYQPEYHHNLRGVIGKYLQNTKYEDQHRQSNNITYTFSNPSRIEV